MAIGSPISHAQIVFLTQHTFNLAKARGVDMTPYAPQQMAPTDYEPLTLDVPRWGERLDGAKNRAERRRLERAHRRGKAL
ncbi:hypothetical protein AEAC466_04420 [Asticcacaulis sp. AC466]|uniref:hypothetical protein n=1 Tax=Asticcacaulis sp. AC466 TaxID=1282362 RepID=UPI0003C3DE07|nr:hypothetical protein [Asticcacaulis sp. AC466]ESQ85415.1 hypothetical protein AEAC466_04420 [Asticcacaulis sp. AC466]